MFSYRHSNRQSGFTLVEVIIASAIMGLVFIGIFTGFELALHLIAQSRAKLTALSLATDRIEYIKSLSFDTVGTISGIPNGPLPQNRTVTQNNITFNERVLVEFVDDPADGQGGSDTNGVVGDYKTVKVEYTWNVYDVAGSLDLIARVVPRSIETGGTGGTIRVNVHDAAVVPVEGAAVRLRNTALTPNIDVTRYTDVTGTALFTGAPAGGGYQAYVSLAGYSSDGTRVATSTLSDPANPPLAVAVADISTVTFAIDKVSEVGVSVYDNETIGSFTETFTDGLGIVATTNATTSGGALRLSGTAGSYPASGLVFLNQLSPSPLVGWGIAKVHATTTAATKARVRFYGAPTSTERIAESVLPGNTAGFTDTYIDLTGIDAEDYPTLFVGITLESTNPNQTPEVADVTVEYATARNARSGLPITFRSTKLLGSNSGTPVPKFATTTTTNGAGNILLTNIEWDTYALGVGGSSVIAEICPRALVPVAPDSERQVRIKLENPSLSTLRTEVVNVDGLPVIGATVELKLGATTITREAGWCGQTFMNGLIDDSGYTLTVSAPGYTTAVQSLEVGGTTQQVVMLAKS